MESPISPFPLESVSELQLLSLGTVLWGWEVCNTCEAGNLCSSPTCARRRSRRLIPFFNYYKQVTKFYVPELLDGGSNALRSHQDVLEIIQTLKRQPNVPRSQLTHEYFSTRDKGNALAPPQADQNRAIDLAVRVMSMVNCSNTTQDFGLIEQAIDPISWRQDMTFSCFIVEAFPKSDHPSLDEKNPTTLVAAIKARISAKKLKKLAGLRFRATDDLRNHLKLDRKEGIVDIYHHTAVIREHLNSSRYITDSATVDECIRSGNIPRQLALEVLDSLQMILFPPDSDSQSLLRSLISKESFDPDILRFESARYRSTEENETTYPYFGSRLMDLHEEVENPTPRGLLEKWMERRSGARYVMMATLIGVVMAVVLGLLGLAVGIFQAWVGYQQWKHPVSS